MQTGKGQVNELVLLYGLRNVRISCAEPMIPAPGQYLLASDGSDAPLSAPLSYTESAPGGFIAAPAPDSWNPGMEIFLRGSLGNGFKLPATARKIVLVAFEPALTHLRALIPIALKQGASLVVVADFHTEDLPPEVEVQPLAALGEILTWADYAAFSVSRGALPSMMELLRKLNQTAMPRDAQVLIQTPVPCGGLAECGVCAVTTRAGWKMACKDGPVFDLREI